MRRADARVVRCNRLAGFAGYARDDLKRAEGLQIANAAGTR